MGVREGGDTDTGRVDADLDVDLMKESTVGEEEEDRQEEEQEQQHQTDLQQHDDDGVSQMCFLER